MVNFTSGDKVYAVYLPRLLPDPVKFYTADEDSIQVGSFNRPAGYAVRPHTHDVQYRPKGCCQEVVIVRRGILGVTVYDDSRRRLGDCFVRAGELIILLAGWHSITVLEDADFLEVKTGPYSESAKVFDFQDMRDA